MSCVWPGVRSLDCWVYVMVCGGVEGECLNSNYPYSACVQLILGQIQCGPSQLYCTDTILTMNTIAIISSEGGNIPYVFLTWSENILYISFSYY